MKDFYFFIRNTKNNHSSASGWWENTKSGFKGDATNFSEEILLFRENQTLILKRRLQNLSKREISNHKLSR